MLKKMSVFVVTLLLVGSVSAQPLVLPGSVTQIQSFNIGDICNSGMASVVALTHGNTGGSVAQSLTVSNVQSSPCFANPCFNISSKGCGFGCGKCGGCSVDALQTQCADLDQSASANGSCAIVNVQAYLDTGGAQTQFIGSSTGSKQQGQSLGLAAQEVVTRADGAGGGGATNGAFLTQSQAGSNAAGSAFESSTIDACQVSEAGGAANSTAALAASMLATTSQSQQVQ